jgi:hypothetical protein
VAAVGAAENGNLTETGAPGTRPVPLVVEVDAEATAIFDAPDDEMTGRQRAAIGTDQSAGWRASGRTPPSRPDRGGERRPRPASASRAARSGSG